MNKCWLTVIDGDKVEEKYKATVENGGAIVTVFGSISGKTVFKTNKHKPAMKQAIDWLILGTTLFDPVTMRVTVLPRLSKKGEE